MLFDRRLTDEEMALLKQAVDGEVGSPVREPSTRALVCFYMEIAGCDLVFGGPYDPKDFQIPEDQWKQVCEWLIAASDDHSKLDRVNYGLDWVNTGPAAQPQTRVCVRCDGSGMAEGLNGLIRCPSCHGERVVRY
jgi:hypothetical protein